MTSRRPRAGHAGLHVARAGPRRVARGRCPQRRLQPGRRALRNAHRPAAVSGRPPAAAAAGAGRRAAAAAQRSARRAARPGGHLPQGDEQVARAAAIRRRRSWPTTCGRYPARPADPGPADGLCRADAPLVPPLSAGGERAGGGAGRLGRPAWSICRACRNTSCSKTALDSARLETKMLDEVWRFYSEEIEDIDSKTTNVRITENYRTCTRRCRCRRRSPSTWPSGSAAAARAWRSASTAAIRGPAARTAARRTSSTWRP